jgi:hypothetical protein
MIFAGDIDAIHARIEDGSEPHFSKDLLPFQEHGDPRSLSIAVLLGEGVAGRAPIFRETWAKNPSILRNS